MKIETNLRHSDLSAVAHEAKAVEALGYDGLTASETNRNPFFPLVLAAEHTRQLTLSTSVAIAFPRSPTVVAHAAWDLQRFSGGRFTLGLGPQVKGHNERRFGIAWSAPGPRLRDYPKIPIYISAINPYMCRLVGEACDGVRLHSFTTPEYLRTVIMPNIEAGLAKAGRARADISVCGGGFLATGETEQEVERARREARRRIAFYGSTRTYHPVLAVHGWTALGEELHALSLQGKWEEMTRLISDDVLQAFTTIGTYDEIVPRLRQRCAGLVDTISFPMPIDSAGRERLQGLIGELKRIS